MSLSSCASCSSLLGAGSVSDDVQDLRALIRPVRSEAKRDAGPAADRAGVAAVQQPVSEDKALAPGPEGLRLERRARLPEHQIGEGRLERLEARVVLERNLHFLRVDDDRIPAEKRGLLVFIRPPGIDHRRQHHRPARVFQFRKEPAGPSVEFEGLFAPAVSSHHTVDAVRADGGGALLEVRHRGPGEMPYMLPTENWRCPRAWSTGLRPADRPLLPVPPGRPSETP